MTCGGCVARVQAALDDTPQIDTSRVQLASPQASITFAPGQAMSPAALAAVVHAAGAYEISAEPDQAATPSETPSETPKAAAEASTGWAYKPLAIIVAFILGVSLLAQWPFAAGLDGTIWMRHFMAGFFLVFSGFKLLNLNGFADSYRMYDLLAARWRGWGVLYPFVELGLGVMYLLDLAPFATNLTTVIVLGFSSIGVIRSVLSRQTIRCACLGDVFNLPMSTVTIIEDLAMVAMAGLMIVMGG